MRFLIFLGGGSERTGGWGGEFCNIVVLFFFLYFTFCSWGGKREGKGKGKKGGEKKGGRKTVLVFDIAFAVFVFMPLPYPFGIGLQVGGEGKGGRGREEGKSWHGCLMSDSFGATLDETPEILLACRIKKGRREREGRGGRRVHFWIFLVRS